MFEGIIDGVFCGREHFQDLFDVGFDLAFGEGALEGVDGLAFGEDDHGGERLDLQLSGDILVLVGVDFDQPDLAPVGGDNFFQSGSELLAGATPGGPEVHEHGGIEAGFEDGLAEVLVVALTDEGGCVGCQIHCVISPVWKLTTVGLRSRSS